MGWLTNTVVKDPGPALNRLVRLIGKHPVAATSLGGATVAAGTAFGPEAIAQESEFMKNRMGAPGGKFVFAQEDVRSFLEEEFRKEAAVPIKPPMGSWNTIWQEGLKGIGSGIGGGVGVAGVMVLAEILRKAGRGLSQKLLYDTQRKELLRKIITMDPMVGSFEAQNPGVMLKIYASMVAVAPTLSMDINAVTSFLREASQTHGSINYLTIKQLAETEKAIHAVHDKERPLGL